MLKIDGRTLDHGTSEHLRILAVRRVREDKEAPSEVMKSLGLCRTTIYRWLRAYDKGDTPSLKASKAAGPRYKLTDKQKAQVRTWIAGKDPRHCRGIDPEKLGLALSLTAVGRLWPACKSRRKSRCAALTNVIQRQSRKWVRNTYPKLRKRAKRLGASIFFLDEAGFSSEPNLGRTYGMKGQTPVVATSGQRQKVSAISTLNSKGAFWSKVYTSMLNAGRFVELLKDFRAGAGFSGGGRPLQPPRQSRQKLCQANPGYVGASFPASVCARSQSRRIRLAARQDQRRLEETAQEKRIAQSSGERGSGGNQIKTKARPLVLSCSKCSLC